MQPSAAADASVSVPSSRDCAAEFIRTTIPIDIVFSTTLRFLVWREASFHNADESDDTVVKNNGPDLLTLSPDFVLLTQPPPKEQLDDAYEQLRTMYDPLLIAMKNVYPRFVLALFVHLVDSILCSDAACQNQLANIVNAVGTCNEFLDLKQLEHNIQHFSRWIHYIMSRDYHIHFDRLASMYVSATT